MPRIAVLVGLLALAAPAFAADVPMVMIHLKLDSRAPRDAALMARTQDAAKAVLGVPLNPSADDPDEFTAFGTPLIPEARRRPIYEFLAKAWGERVRVFEATMQRFPAALPPAMGTRVDREVIGRVFPAAANVNFDGGAVRPAEDLAPLQAAFRVRLGDERRRDNPRYWSQRQIFDAVRSLQASEGVGRDVDVRVATALFWHESAGGDTRAVGPRTRWGRARGIAQFIEATGRQYGLRTQADFFDPVKSLRAGLRHLQHLYVKFRGNVALMVAAYNSGEFRRSLRGGTIPKIRQTVRYVADILGNVNRRLAAAERRFDFASYMPRGWERYLPRTRLARN